MRRIAHGSTSPPKPTADDGFESAGSDQAGGTPFGHLFPDLAQDDASLLPRSSVTLDNLARLGDAMRDTTQSAAEFSNIPAAYTYLGQFLDHDITFTEVTKAPRDLTDSCMLGDSLLAPWDVEFIKRNVKNKRAGILELDSVYGGDPPKEGGGKLFKLGRVTDADGGVLPPGRDAFQDVPRGSPNNDPAKDRVAQIGDPRNDQNVLISQLHVAFLRAHNAIVELLGCTFEEARLVLRQHYHCIVVQDYLEKVTAPGTVGAVLADPRYRPEEGEFFLPLEFTVAAFRFGHSMIRNYYRLNAYHGFRDLRLLFTLAAMGAHTRLPVKAVIEWEAFLSGYSTPNAARRLDTHLVNPLRTVLDEKEQPVPCETRLAVLDLKRGYMMRIPTGQAVARKLGLTEMTAGDIEAAVPDEAQRRVLRDSGFLERTPLWFYILAEASSDRAGGGGGQHLGAVGSRLVAEVLVGLVRRSRPSILDQTGAPWTPRLPCRTAGRFELADLLRLAGVLRH